MWSAETVAADWFGVSAQTVNRWCREYHPFISLTAQKGRGECITEDDAKVLTYINIMRLGGKRRTAIWHDLRRGKRGELPLAASARTEADKDALILRLRGCVAELRTELDAQISERDSAKREAASERRKREIAEKDLAVEQRLYQQTEERLSKLEATLERIYLRNGRVVPPQSPARPPSKQ